MYAVIKTGGKQYRVENDQKLLVERIKAEEGSIVTLSNLLMVVDSGKVSTGDQLQNVAVSAAVIKQTRGPKIITLKHRRIRSYGTIGFGFGLRPLAYYFSGQMFGFGLL